MQSFNYVKSPESSPTPWPPSRRPRKRKAGRRRSELHPDDEARPRRARPTLVNLSDVAEMKGISVDGDTVT
jgi:hypothetical protein